MPEAGAAAIRPSVFTVPLHRSFADALVAGLIARHGKGPMALAEGRILAPNNRAVRSLTEAFVRASGGGLVLPRLIAIGDPELDDRIGGALDPAGAADEPVPPAIDPLARQLALARLIKQGGKGTAEALRLAADLGRTLDALTIEEVAPERLSAIAAGDPELAGHWQASMERLQAISQMWPQELRRRGVIDLSDRRNRLLRATARRWSSRPPKGFTIAAGVTTAAPAVAELLSTVARMPGGAVVLPGLALEAAMPAEEWQALIPDEGRGEPAHPQYHLKLLLDRMGIAREEVAIWRGGGRAASPAVRSRAVAHAMAAAEFSDKWSRLAPAERRLTGIKAIELADPAAEATAIALKLREALETPERTAALVTPDRALAGRVAAMLDRWGIGADDSAGKPLSQTPSGTLLLAIVAAAAEDLAPVPLLALAKHPLVGGEGEDRVRWLAAARQLDAALRGPRPAAGLSGLDRHFADKAQGAWGLLRPPIERLAAKFAGDLPLAALAARLREVTEDLCGPRAWTNADGRAAAECVAALEGSVDGAGLTLDRQEWVPVLRGLLDAQAVRPPYGGHPRIFIWGLLEARLQKADLLILAGLNEGSWPALPAPDPWLAPRIRSELGLPSLDFRIGLAAHDFASALGAPRVLLTRARRDARSPTVPSRFWLRLEAMTGGLARDHQLARIAAALDRPQMIEPADRPAPCPPASERPDRISVTAVDRLNADPYAFYAQQILGLRALDSVDADHSAAWKGTAVHRVLQQWLEDDQCDPDRLRPRAEALLADAAIHPMLRALWAPRLLEAIDWIAELERSNRAEGRIPLRAEVAGEAPIAGVTVYGRADRVDRLADGTLAILDYKTGAPPSRKAVEKGFALQLGLLGLIGRAGGLEQVSGDPTAFEYWSLARHNGVFGRLMRPDKDMADGEFLDRAYAAFATAAARYLTGEEPFTAKLNPAFAPYGDYDQLMRLEEWYGRA